MANVTVTVTDASGNKSTKSVAYSVTSTPPPTTTSKFVLGVQAGAGGPYRAGNKWDAVRSYRKSKNDEAIKTFGAKVLFFSTIESDMPTTASAIKAELERVNAMAKAAGITDFKGYYAIDNEVDREQTTDAQIAAFLKEHKELAPVVRAAGWGMTMNLTRFSTTNGLADKFALGPEYVDMYAINCYADNMEKDPVTYNTNWTWLDNMFKWVKGTGVKNVSGWESGHRANSSNPTGRPTWARQFAFAYRDRALAAGLNPVGLCWWDNTTGQSATRDTRFETDGTKTRDAWLQAMADIKK